MNTIFAITLVAILGLIRYFPSSTRADSFTLDATRSQVTMSGQAAGGSIQPQGTGSLTTHFEGVLEVDRTGATIQFTEASRLTAITNGIWEPLPDGEAGSAPAEFAGQASILFSTAKVAAREIELGLMSGTLALANGEFDASGLVFYFPSDSTSRMDYRYASFLGTQAGSIPLEGYATNQVATTATLVETNGQWTLTIPVDAVFKRSLLAPDDTEIVLTGQLVAVPGAATELQIDRIWRENQAVHLSWQATPGTTYTVMQSSDLASWSVADQVVASDNPAVWTTNMAATVQFFKLRQ